MASGTKSKGKGAGAAKGKGSRSSRPSVVSRKPIPWGTILAVVAVLALAGGVFTYAAVKINAEKKYTVSEGNQDPSVNIDGVTRVTYSAGQHVKADQRVAYDQSPPFGGPHDQVWADCSGVVYPTAVRSENMVHALEHGAIWIAYNPDQIKDAQLDKLKGKVDGQADMMLSPYPNLDKPISLQSWGHQLKLDNPDDARIDQFVKSLKRNQYQNPEPRGRCDSTDTGFQVSSPPPFVADKPGPDAVGMDGKGAIDEAQAEQQGAAPTAAPTDAVPTDAVPTDAVPSGSQPPSQ